MKKEKSSAMGTPYTFEGRIPLKQAIPLGLQHVMAMFIGNLTPLLIIMGACGCGLRCTSYGSFAECNDSSRYCNTGTDVFDWTDRR